MDTFIEQPASKKSLDQRKLLFGKGNNNADYITQYVNESGKLMICPYYRKWTGMLTRCYSSKYQIKQPTYIDCTVVTEWLNFMTFREWMKTQNWQGMELDKDIAVIGNKIYGPKTCNFVTRAINNLINDNKRKKGNYPKGVSFLKNNKNKYQASYAIDGKNKYLGCFKTPEEASATYKKFKYDHILTIANQQTEPLKSALIKHADLLH